MSSDTQKQLLINFGGYDNYYYPILNEYYTTYGFYPKKFTISNCDYIVLNELLDKYKDSIEYYNETFVKNMDSKKDHLLQSTVKIKCKTGKKYLIFSNIRKNDDKICGDVLFVFDEKDAEFEEVKEMLIKNGVVTEDKPKIYLVVPSNGGGYDLESFTIKRMQIDFDVHYNEDFKEINNLILKNLKAENNKGLVLLYGEPGTGKTSYIRYLSSNLKEKRMIYLSPNMFRALSDPALIQLFTRYSNSILVLEDAELALRKRMPSENNPSVSNILNLSDGLLSDCLNIQIVATFNSDLKEIDDALLRKGRLIAKYEFSKLNEDRIKNYCDKNNIEFNSLDTKTVTISNLINMDEKDFTIKKSKIGFNSGK